MKRRMNAIIRIRRGTYSQWYSYNPVLEEGEISFVTSGADQGKIKVGDGTTAWRNLPYTAARFPEDILTLEDAEASDLLPNKGDVYSLFQQIRNFLKHMLNKFNPDRDIGHTHNGTDSPKVSYSDLENTDIITDYVDEQVEEEAQRRINIDNKIYESLDGVQTLTLEGALLTRDINGTTEIQRSMFPPDTVFAANKTLINDADGTVGVYKEEADPITIRISTLTKVMEQQSSNPNGLLAVNHDATLTGEGTSASPLKIAGAVTQQIAQLIDKMNRQTKVGDFYIQYPDAEDPNEKFGEQWIIYNEKAVSVGLLPVDANATRIISLASEWKSASSTAVNAYRIHIPGGDSTQGTRRILKCKTAVTNQKPEEINPINWETLEKEPGYMIVERSAISGYIIGNTEIAWGIADKELAIGAMVFVGANAYRVVETFTWSGTFPSMAGVNRPPFNQGIQNGRIVNIEGSVNLISREGSASGVFAYTRYNDSNLAQGASGNAGTVQFQASRSVNTGNDVASTNVSVLIWRKI